MDAGSTRIGRRMRLRDMHIIKVVAEHGSMARAAEDLGLSQPAISKVIADLEKDLGVALFERSSRGAVLTEPGRVLLQRGINMIDELKQGLEEIDNLTDPSAGEVRIGIVEAWLPFVASVVQRSTRRFGRITFTVKVGDVDTLLQSLRDRALDLVVSREVLVNEHADLYAEHLFQDRLVVVCGHKHRLARARKLKLANLVHERWALGPSDTYLGRLLTSVFRKHGCELPAATVTSASVQLRLQLLTDGQFITVYSAQMLPGHGNRSPFKILPVDLGDVAVPMAALTLKSRPPRGATKIVVAEMKAAAKSV